MPLFLSPKQPVHEQCIAINTVWQSVLLLVAKNGLTGGGTLESISSKCFSPLGHLIGGRDSSLSDLPGKF